MENNRYPEEQIAFSLKMAKNLLPRGGGLQTNRDILDNY